MLDFDHPYRSIDGDFLKTLFARDASSGRNHALAGHVNRARNSRCKAYDDGDLPSS